MILRYVLAALLIGGSVLPASASDAVPELSGIWAREVFDFELPLSGPGPVTNRSRIRTGQGNLSQLVGDYTNPILKPEAAQIVKKRGEIALTGVPAPDPSNQCRPMPPPYILQFQEIQVLQQKDQVTIIYAENNEVRRVRLNRMHPAHLIPTWYGDSIGHFEGDTLVVDTVGIKVGALAMVDRYGTPYSDALHVVERYRLIDYEAAKDAITRSETENIHVPGGDVIGNGVAIDSGYRGKGLQVEFTVEDRNVFTTTWSGMSTFLRARDWVERICAENPHVYYGNDTAIPTADKPDF